VVGDTVASLPLLKKTSKEFLAEKPTNESTICWRQGEQKVRNARFLSRFQQLSHLLKRRGIDLAARIPLPFSRQLVFLLSSLRLAGEAAL
jgi:hypothetical protein